MFDAPDSSRHKHLKLSIEWIIKLKSPNEHDPKKIELRNGTLLNKWINKMSIIAGHFLNFRGSKKKALKHKWCVSILVVRQGPQTDSCTLVIDGYNPKKKILHSIDNIYFIRFEIDLEQDAKQQAITYTINSQSYNIVIPGHDEPLSIAFASCNGFSDLSKMKNVAQRNSMWKDLMQKHNASRYHLLIMGGDQVYADSLWGDVPSIREWKNLPLSQRRCTPPNLDTMKEELEKFYLNLYRRVWGYGEVLAPLSSIPTIMMWDDHDIFDGWGSYSVEDQQCDVFQAIFAVAKKYFLLFQQHIAYDEKREGMIAPTNYSLCFKVSNNLIVVPDLRSERTQNHVMAQKNWDAIYKWLDNIPANEYDHLLFVSTIPVVYPSFSYLESLLGIIPGQQDLEDDLKDHWNNRSHKAERLRLIHRLLDFSKRKHTRTTIISGDVHVAALGILQSQRDGLSHNSSQVINQLISSSIVHPTPPGIVLFAIEQLAKFEDKIDRDITAYMSTLPCTDRRIIGLRNWLSLEFDVLKRIWASWHLEDQDTPYTKVIHPLSEEVTINRFLRKELEGVEH